jgi:hypothetical protein
MKSSFLALAFVGSSLAWSARADRRIAAAPTPAKKTHVAKKKAKGPKPASVAPAVPYSTSEIGDDDVQVFDENTNFETLLEKHTALARQPASISPVARVIAVRRELGVTDREALDAAQDIVLNGGTMTGIDEGMTLAVVRKIPVLDPYHENRQSELEVEFAKIKVIHAQGDIAVARVKEIEKIDEGMGVGTRAVLVGDFVTRPTK